ncbi:retrovirus-related Pol polyprotein from transposon 17.6 [Trichonephila clavipes]|nr:retrovirus-related Pol polyprotein from transposon 17.6 [Trichonephila clavipes]
MFQICEEENIKLKFSKCVFAKTKINFLCYEIEEGCITPDNQNIETIKKLQPPKNVKQLQSFLGSVNVDNKFIDSYAKIRKPLNQLLKKDKQWDWTAECQTAFELLKNKLITKAVLQLYDPKLPLHVFCDASLKAIGDILKQPDNSGTLHPVSFHSRTLREYEKNYCITELECLAIVDALDKFYYYLHGKKFIIHTDHAALVWLKNVKNLRGRLFRWSLKLSMFDYETVPPQINLLSISLLILSVGGFNYYNSTIKFLHLIIDHATRYVWAFASKSETTETYANCLKQLFQIQIPIKLLTDRYGAFTSSRFKRFLRNYNVKQLLTTSHHPQTNGKCERVNQSIVTKLRCKVNSSPTKIPWTKFLEQVINEYNLTPHSVIKFPPAYLLFGTLPYTPPLAQNQVYPPVEEARKLAKENTIKYHEKNKIKYDARFIDSPFEPGDLVIYEEFNYPNRRKLSPIFSGPY